MDEKILLNDVFYVFSSSKPSLYKAIFSLIFSSGMTPTDLSKLTLNDFLIACDDYFSDKDEKTLKNLLNKNPWDIIPCWKFESDYKITFCTPESTFYIFMYLKDKRTGDLDNLVDPLFKSGENNFLTASKISSYVTQFNKLGFEKGYFKSKNLIKTFELICNQHLNLEKEHKDNLIELFLRGNKQYFMEYANFDVELKNYYKLIVPFLTARLYDFDKQVIRYENSLKSHNIDNYQIIKDYFKLNVRHNLDLTIYDETLLCKFAYDISQNEVFLNTSFYLEKLFKKAQIRLNIYNHISKRNFRYLREDLSLKRKTIKIETVMNNSGLKNIINLDKINISEHITSYIVKEDWYDKPISKTDLSKIIEDILFDIINTNDDVVINSKYLNKYVIY